MKKILCNLCGKSIEEEWRFKIKVTSPFYDVRDFTAHCCADCYEEKLYDFLFNKEINHDKS